MFVVIISSAQILIMADGIIKLIIAEDHAGLRETLVAVFRRFSQEIIVVAEAENGKELIKKVELYSPDIVLTDIQMPLMDGIEATRIIKARHPYIGIIAFSMLNDAFSLKDMIAAGAQGYLLKSADKEELLKAVKEVYGGGIYYSKEVEGYISGLD
jgi:two-component system nitrate/nitrite response regulator NarL